MSFRPFSPLSLRGPVPASLPPPAGPQVLASQAYNLGLAAPYSATSAVPAGADVLVAFVLYGDSSSSGSSATTLTVNGTAYSPLAAAHTSFGVSAYVYALDAIALPASVSVAHNKPDASLGAVGMFLHYLAGVEVPGAVADADTSGGSTNAQSNSIAVPAAEGVLLSAVHRRGNTTPPELVEAGDLVAFEQSFPAATLVQSPSSVHSLSARTGYVISPPAASYSITRTAFDLDRNAIASLWLPAKA